MAHDLLNPARGVRGGRRSQGRPAAAVATTHRAGGAGVRRRWRPIRPHARDIPAPCPTGAQTCQQNGRKGGVGKKESPQLIRVAGISTLASPSVENQELYDANPTASERKSEGAGANSDANRRTRERRAAQNSGLIRPIRPILPSSVKDVTNVPARRQRPSRHFVRHRRLGKDIRVFLV